jgi:hypothetical protein
MDVVRVSSYRVRWAAVLAGVALFVLAAPAEARPLSGSGTGTLTSIDVDVIREAGGNVTQVRQVEGSVDGAIEGTFVQTVTGVVHKSGLVTFHGTMTFTGTVDGCGDGTFMVGVTGRAQAGIPTADAKFRVINQATNTLGVTGTGTLHQVGPDLTYEVAYTC